MQTPQIDAPSLARPDHRFDRGLAVDPLVEQPTYDPLIDPFAGDTTDEETDSHLVAHGRWLLDELDGLVADWMSRSALRALQLAIGVIFLWFGALKFFPGLSPAEELVVATARALFDPIGLPIPGRVVILLLACWEVTVGLGMLVDRHRRAVVWMLILHMFSTALPLVLLPHLVWTQAPIGLTLEGQYIVKNLVILAGATAIGATVRGVRPPWLSPDDGSDQAGSEDDRWPAATAPRVWVVDERGSLLATYELDGYYADESR